MKKFRIMAVLCAVLALMLSFATVAYAGGGEEIPEPTETPFPEPSAAPNPFTPAGTGTVLDNATNEDGKEFFTIITPDENVFYLVIDRQREQENVYFLNAVTEKDLLALAEKSGDTQDSDNLLPTPEPEKTPETTPGPEASAEPSPVPEQNSNTGMLIMVLAVVVIGGGAGYYFKIYRPKQERAESEDDFDYGDEADLYGAEDAEQADELPPWEDEDSGDGQA